MNLTPYGMDACSICDAPTTHTIENGDCWYPYCAACAKMVKDEFPKVRVMIWGVKEAATT